VVIEYECRSALAGGPRPGGIETVLGQFDTFDLDEIVPVLGYPLLKAVMHGL
jgi:hypothetical protein